MVAGLPPGALDRASLGRLLAGDPPLVAGMPDPAAQLQVNGVDLTLRSVAWLGSLGQIGVANGDRVLAAAQELAWGPEGYAHLAPGPYLATLNETLNVPLDTLGLLWPRSSLLRCGVAVHTAVVDAGYSGRPQVLLSVLNPHGFRLQQHARIVQLAVFTLVQPVAAGYQGAYQGA